ncbi:MAG: IPT/TIG domain-containing protein, partial [bacterium]
MRRACRSRHPVARAVWQARSPTSPPAITTISPTAGPVAGGNTVTINGSGFLGVTSVKFGGVAATTFTISSSTKITATAPASTAGAKDVVVSGPWGTATKTGGYTYYALPTVTSVTPNQGSTTGGTAVTITGTNLVGATSVKFGTTLATGVVVVNDTTITAFAPAATAGAKSVSVTTPGGTGTLASAFTYFAPPAITTIVPALGPTTGGTAVTINGSGFLGATSVTIGGVSVASFTITSST